MSDSLWPHETQHTRPPCPSPTPGVHSNPCPLSWWCHPTILSSVIPFSCPQSFPASGSFQMSQLFISGTKVLEFNSLDTTSYFFLSFHQQFSGSSSFLERSQFPLFWVRQGQHPTCWPRTETGLQPSSLLLGIVAKCDVPIDIALLTQES